MQCLRIYADAAGESHFEDTNIQGNRVNWPERAFYAAGKKDSLDAP